MVTNRAADVRRKTLAYASPGAMPSGLTLPMPGRGHDDTLPMATLPGARELREQSASKKALAAFLGETELAPVSMPPSLPASIGATASARVTVLPRVEMVGSEPRVVSESRLRYLAESKLGEGGIGEVVGARDQDIGRRVAVKRLRQEVKSDAALLRFAEEIRTVGKLEHPNIVPVHDVGIDEQGDHYFVMKYVDGETLERIIEQLAAGDAAYLATYTIERRVEIFMALCEAVSFAHSRGIIHRDIKPANIMVGAYGEVVLMDWGVAKVRGSEPEPSRPSPGVASPAAHTVPSDALSTVAGALVGTPFYMSPEQAKGLPADERSDVYSLCLVFYELLALQHPLEKKVSLAEVLQGAAVEPVPTLHSIRHRLSVPVPVELNHFLRHGLEKDPALRYPTVTAMIERLRARAMGDIPVECPATFIKATTARWNHFVDRSPAGALTAVGLGALGVVASVLMMVLLIVR